MVNLAHSDAEEMATALECGAGRHGYPGSYARHARSECAALKGRNIKVVPNAGSRAVLLTGIQADITVAKGLIALLDEKEGGGKPETKIYKLAHAKADTVRQVLSETLGVAQVAGNVRRPQAAALPLPVYVSADQAGNAVVVSAASDVQEQVAALVMQLDSAEAADAAEKTEIVPLAHGKASAMADALNAARGIDPTRRNMPVPGVPGSVKGPSPVTAVDQGNCLVLTGRAEELADMKKLIQQLDDAGAKLMVDVKFFPLQHAKAKDLVDVLQTMLAGAEPASAQGQNYMPQPGMGQRPNVPSEVHIAAAEQTNTLIVQGSPDNLTMADQIIRQLDVGQADNRVVVEIVPLANAQAPSLADAINTMLSGGSKATQANAGPYHPGGAAGDKDSDKVTVTPEINSNSLLVRGPANRVSEVLATIKQLDGTGTSSAAQMRTYKLANNDAKELASSLGTLFHDMIKQMPSTGGGTGGASSANNIPFSISADERTNSLVVSTTKTYFTMFEQLLNQLENTEIPQRDVYYVSLTNADAYDLAKKLDSLFRDRKGPDAPTIETDSYTNSLTIIAKEADFKQMQTLIDKIDKLPTRKVQVISVSGMKAEQLAAQLQKVYPQLNENADLRVVEQLPGKGEKPESSVAPPPVHAVPAVQSGAPASAPAVPAIMRADDTRGQVPPASAPAATPGKLPVLIAVDKRSNALIVSATQQEIDAIKDLARQLSSTTDATGDTEIRWFALEHADPTAVAATLDKLFNPQVPVVPAPAPAQQNNKGSQSQPAAAPPVPVIVPAQKIIVVPEMRTRNLIVKAKTSDLEQVEPIIKQLDKGTVVETDVRTFPLVNTDATELALNLRELFRLSNQGAAGGTSPQALRVEDIRQLISFGTDAQGNQLSADSLETVAITANRATNSVVVSAPRQAMSIVEDVIKELDQSAGQSTRPVVRMYPTKVDDVTALAATITKMFSSSDQASAAAAMMPGRPSSRQRTPVIVTADESSRLVIVSAAPEQHEQIAKIIEQIQSAQGESGLSTKVIQLHKGKAVDVAKSLSIIADAGKAAKNPAAGAAAAPPVTISAEQNSNSIMLTGTAAAVEKFSQMIDQLEQNTTASAEGVFILPLERAKAPQMAETIMDLQRQQLIAAQRSGKDVPPLAVTADERSNSLVISCSPDRFKEVVTWVKQVEEMNPKRGTPRIIQLENVDPNEFQAAIEHLYGSSSSAGPAGAAIGKAGKVTAPARPRRRSLLT